MLGVVILLFGSFLVFGYLNPYANIMESRAIFRMRMGICMRVVFWALLFPLYEILGKCT